jgi:hypothetical protein
MLLKIDSLTVGHECWLLKAYTTSAGEPYPLWGKVNPPLELKPHYLVGAALHPQCPVMSLTMNTNKIIYTENDAPLIFILKKSELLYCLIAS